MSVLFSKNSQDSDEDVWDDTALIRAYEKSVESIKQKRNSRKVINVNKKEAELSKYFNQSY